MVFTLTVEFSVLVAPDCSPIILVVIFNVEKKSHVCHILLIYLDSKTLQRKHPRFTLDALVKDSNRDLPCQNKSNNTYRNV